MRSPKSYPARQLRARSRQWRRKNTKAVCVVAAGVAGMSVFGSSLIWLTSPDPPRGYVLGAFHVALIATALHLLNAAFLAHDQTAIHQLRGTWGDDNTRSELQRAKRQGLVWGWVDSIELQAGDIDHLVVTRNGGLVMIDSKWRNQVDVNTVQEMTHAAQRAGVRAQGVARTLLKADRTAKHRARVQALTVTPVVVLWGAARTDLPDGIVKSGVTVIDGRRLLSWLAALEAHPVPRDAADDLLNRLERFRATSGESQR